jgi:hypothetical protein
MLGSSASTTGNSSSGVSLRSMRTNTRKNYIAAAGTIRQDDVVPALQPVLEVTPALREFLAGRSLRQQYWYEWFAELIIDRLWDELEQAGEGGG